MNRKRAFTLPEILVTIALGGLIALMTGISLKSAANVFGNTSGRDAAMRELMRARRALEADLPKASLAPNRLAIQPVPSIPGPGSYGDAINFTSAVNATSGEVMQLDDGTGGMWHHRNLYFYISVPLNHDSLFGSTCTLGSEAGGYDYNCPHKILLRGLADQNPATSPHNNSTEDALLTPLNPFLSRPTGFPKTPTLHTVAANLLSFRVQRVNQELQIDLRAVSLPDARSRRGIGTQSYRTGGYTIEQRFSIFPKN